MKYAWVIKGDFFRLWSGTFLSLFSSVLFYYSLVWWSLSETGSALSGSIVIGIGLTVSILISPFTGWLSDRFHRGKLIAASDMIISAVFLMIGFLAVRHEFGYFTGGCKGDCIGMFDRNRTRGKITLARYTEKTTN
ncbi:hypothetical protein [Bacillus haynesii]|uniref:hypothetical protein n=1 Tax=Bacillus haynesii TaxID=1925021 RepID=UPI0022822F0B|nr:hypothetical protein [Bacillus haynesii]MCY8593126.1 hypothetical protein [Bacillus haynesii]MCY8668861.1 hypothetical protein [Bacillus haynesii]MEC0553125.1 hypothetical protein [Bacillus haynesii]